MSAIEIAKVLARKRGHTLQIHVTEAVIRLRLSTQMQVSPVYYTSGHNCVIRVGNSNVRLQHKPPAWFQHVNSKVSLVLTALFYLGPAAHNPKLSEYSERN